MHIYKLDKQNEFKRRIRFPDNIIIMKLNKSKKFQLECVNGAI